MTTKTKKIIAREGLILLLSVTLVCISLIFIYNSKYEYEYWFSHSVLLSFPYIIYILLRITNKQNRNKKYLIVEPLLYIGIISLGYLLGIVTSKAVFYTPPPCVGGGLNWSGCGGAGYYTHDFGMSGYIVIYLVYPCYLLIHFIIWAIRTLRK